MSALPYGPYRLKASGSGPHKFGGPTKHAGSTPHGTDVPLQLVLSLDLTDPNWPIEQEFGVKSLPLYYPFKYGSGGSEIQYALRSDGEIEILHLSHSKPDDDDSQYLKVNELPRESFALEPLTYEQARALAFALTYGDLYLNEEDRLTLDRIDLKNLILVENAQRTPSGPEIICRNRNCEHYGRRVNRNIFVTVPPISVDGSDDFWYEFQGGDVHFCFGFTYCCGSIIAFNVAG